jgi:carbon-monoxide dehydrogenase medium subunit
MKAPSFDYVRPGSLPEVFEVLENHREDARILAGGQSLMATLNMRLSAPAILVDINRIGGLSGIDLDGGMLRIGAMARHVEVERSPLVARCAPLISRAIRHIAHPAIRNRGTFGGSIAFADPAAELPACVVALGARLVIEGSRGRRMVAADDFFQGLYRTALSSDEVLVAVEIPVATAEARHGFLELARRHGDYAMIGVAAKARLRSGALSDVRLVYFAAGDRPVLAGRASAALEGGPNSADARRAAMDALDGDLDPPEDLNASAAMRLHLAKVLTRRVLEDLVP